MIYPGMLSLEIFATLAIILLAVVFFMKEWFSVDTVSVMVMITFIITGILTPEEGFSGFTNAATVTIAAMFVLSAAVFKTGVLDSFGRIILAMGKRHYVLALLSVMLMSGLLSAFINDTGVVALFLPVVIQVSHTLKISPSRLLMPLSFGALMGGVCTLIGTSTNILVHGIAVKSGLPGFGMFDLTPGGLVFLGAGILYMLFVGQFLLPNRKVENNFDDTYDLGSYLTEIILLPEAKSVGVTVAQSRIVKDLEVQIMRITRNGENVEVSPYTVLMAGDLLKVKGDIEKVKKLSLSVGIEIKADQRTKLDNAKLFEAIVPPASSFAGKTLSEINFRNIYNGSSVLAIRHREEIQHEKIGHTHLQPGDILLVRSDPETMQTLKSSDDLILLSKVDFKAPDFKKILPTIVIAMGVITAAATGIMPIVMSAAIGVIILVGIKSISSEEAYKSVDWKVVFMLAGVLSMGTALQKTGADVMISDLIINSIGQFGPRVILSALFLLTFLLTNVMSNNATAALLAPIAIQAAASMHISPVPFLMAITFAASLSFMTPIGYQTNTMIYTPGNYRFNDYLKVGTPLNILLWVIASIVLPILYPF